MTCRVSLGKRKNRLRSIWPRLRVLPSVPRVNAEESRGNPMVLLDKTQRDNEKRKKTIIHSLFLIMVFQ